MKSIVADNATPADLKKYGLDKPAATVNLGLGSAQRHAAVRRQGGRQHGLRARRVEAGGRHGRERAARRPEEERRRLPAQGRLRVPPVQRDARRDHAQRPDRRVRARRRARARTRRTSGSASARPPATSTRRRSTACSASSRTSAPPRSSTSTAKTGLDKPAMTVVVKFDDGKKEERVTFGQVGNDVFVVAAGRAGRGEDRRRRLQRRDQVAR